MKTLEFYFSAPEYSGPDPKFPWAPTPREWYDDFNDVLRTSGYGVTKSEIKQQTVSGQRARDVTITVEGSKR